MLTLTAESRGLTKSARNQARRNGFIPAVVYGKDVSPTPIMVSFQDLREAMKQGGKHQLIQLAGPAISKPCTVLIKELQMDAQQRIAHVDFFQPAKGRRIHIRVPVRVRGEDALTRRGVIMEYHLHEVDCECMPDKVPEAIYIDVANCQPGDHVSLGELKVPEGVKVSGHPGTMVVTIEAPMATMIPGEGVAQVTAGE